MTNRSGSVLDIIGFMTLKQAIARVERLGYWQAARAQQTVKPRRKCAWRTDAAAIHIVLAALTLREKAVSLLAEEVEASRLAPLPEGLDMLGRARLSAARQAVDREGVLPDSTVVYPGTPILVADVKPE